MKVVCAGSRTDEVCQTTHDDREQSRRRRTRGTANISLARHSAVWWQLSVYVRLAARDQWCVSSGHSAD
jgi:hypothetical protein